MTISTTTAIAAYSWAAPRVALSMELSEAQSVQAAMESCDDRIVETARTGSGNRCIFPASRGAIIARTDGLYYSLESSGRLCDPTVDWVVINAEKHIEVECDLTSKGTSNFNLRWRWPSQITINAEDLAGMGGFVGAIATENCPYVPPSPSSPPYPPCPQPTITFDPADVTFNTITVYVEFELTPGASGKTISLTRVQVAPDKVILRADVS